MTHIIYAETAFACILVLLIIMNRVRATSQLENVSKPFLTLLNFSVAFCLVDSAWGVIASHTLWWGPWSVVVVSYAFHAMSALAAFMWFRYFVSYLGGKYQKSRLLHILPILLVSCQLLLLASNFVFGTFFTVDEAGIYTTGILRRIAFYVQFSYYAVSILISLTQLLHTWEEKARKRLITAIVFSGVPLATGFFQMIFPDAPFYSLGFMLACFTIYAFNLTKEREDYLTELKTQELRSSTVAVIEALTLEYTSVYYIDLKNDTFSPFRVDERMEQLFDDPYAENRPYTPAMENYVQKLVLPQDRETVLGFTSLTGIRQALLTQKSARQQYRCTISGEPEYYEIKIVKIGDPHAVPTQVILGLANRDAEVREVEEQQAQLRDATYRAEAANRAKSLFLFNMSHDIRTPMNAIIGFTEMAEKHLDDSARVGECLQKVQVASQHLLRLINEVLDMSRIESGKMKLDIAPANARTGTDMILPIIEEMARDKGVAFTHEFKDLRDENVYADYLHVNQILMNVLSNAVKYTPTGGSVHYTLQQVDSPGPEQVRYRFIVADTGIGMSEEYQQHVFESFSREQTATVSGQEGTGLGMSIVKRLIDLMGGTVTIESRQNVGTTVVCELTFRKVEDDRLMQPAAQEAQAAPIDLTGKRVLLVEDNELNREIARDILEELGLEVEDAEDGAPAVELVRSHAPDYYDAVLMDVQMPVMDGYEATRAIRALPGYDGLPIIAMTANAFAEDRKNALDAGMNAHLSKPIDSARLIETLAAMTQ